MSKVPGFGWVGLMNSLSIEQLVAGDDELRGIER
jgi:hypothetical protein